MVRLSILALIIRVRVIYGRQEIGSRPRCAFRRDSHRKLLARRFCHRRGAQKYFRIETLGFGDLLDRKRVTEIRLETSVVGDRQTPFGDVTDVTSSDESADLRLFQTLRRLSGFPYIPSPCARVLCRPPPRNTTRYVDMQFKSKLLP